MKGQEADVSRGAITLLIVEDDRAVRDACEAFVNAMGYTTIATGSASDGLAIMERTPVDVILTDFRMPGMNGLEFLEAIRGANPDVFVIVMSGYGSIETAVEAMKRGACEFICKPFNLSDLRRILEKIEAQLGADSRARLLRQELDKLGGLSLLIGRSPVMQQMYRIIMRIANSSNPVLILGERGTGKELLARSIHLATKDNNLPFIPVDCCSLMPKQLESELFGHVKGAFQGAIINKQGLLANAECGTVLLNEVTDLSLSAQAKLVQALQERAVRPYGSTKTMPLRARIIATSSHDLAKAVALGKFRQDLYYRLSVLVVRLPALRERKEDIPLLAEHFLRRLSEETGTKKTISVDALRALATFDWTGNVRELETVIERAFALCTGTSITLYDLPQQVSSKLPIRVTKEGPRHSSLAEIEREGVLKAVEDSGGDKQKAARLLGISRTTLYRKLNEYKR